MIRHLQFTKKSFVSQDAHNFVVMYGNAMLRSSEHPRMEEITQSFVN